MSTQPASLTNVQEINNAIASCAGSIAGLAQSLREQVELGNLTGFTVDELVRLEVAARSVQRAFELDAILNPAFQGDFGTATNEALKLAISEILSGQWGESRSRDSVVVRISRI